MFKKFLVFAVAFALVLPMDAIAKGGSSSGGRSSGSGFSGSRSSGSSFSGSRSSGSGFSGGSSRSSSSGFSSKPSTPSSSSSSSRSTPSGFSSKPSAPATHSTPSTSSSRSSPSGFSSSPSTTKPTTSTFTSKPTQTSLDSKVAKANTVSAPSYKTKDQAIAAFKEKNASTYTSKFTTEPKTRPEYIPPSTNVGGKTVNISYNAGFGGYGYYHPTLGTWMAYDMMHDAAMMSMMMNRTGYTYVDGPGYGGGNVVVTHSSGSYWAGVILVIFLIAFIVFMIRIMREM